MSGKTIDGVTHVPQLFPPTSIHPSVGFRFISYHCTMACDQGFPLSFPTPSHHYATCHHHLKDVPQTYRPRPL